LQSVRARLASIESAVAAQAGSLPQLADQLREMAARQEAAEARTGELRAALENLSNRISESQSAIQGWQQAWQSRLEGLEGSLRDLAGAGQILSQLQQNQQSLQARLDKQAEAIRSLHAAAHERLQRREELQAALQRLEQIAGALGETKPLPEDL
jgi:chromosome segregation ATPase